MKSKRLKYIKENRKSVINSFGKFRNTTTIQIISEYFTLIDIIKLSKVSSFFHKILKINQIVEAMSIYKKCMENSFRNDELIKLIEELYDNNEFENTIIEMTSAHYFATFLIKNSRLNIVNESKSCLTMLKIMFKAFTFELNSFNVLSYIHNNNFSELYFTIFIRSLIENYSFRLLLSKINKNRIVTQ
jgi:hypothetical protein